MSGGLIRFFNNIRSNRENAKNSKIFQNIANIEEKINLILEEFLRKKSF